MSAGQKDVAIQTVPWNPPYYFVVVKHPRWDKDQVEVLKLATDGGLAYAIYQYYQQYNVDSIREVVYEQTIQDSFGRDALRYCKQMYDRDIEAGRDLHITLEI